MNIYEKLSRARVELQKMNLKKSGKRNGMSYFELSDFLPQINELSDHLKMLSVVTFRESVARIGIYNLEKPEEKIEIESPFGSASLKGCHEVQNIGAVETYQRRYLYMVAFEIVESDILDGTHEESPKQKNESREVVPDHDAHDLENHAAVICPKCGKKVEPLSKDGKRIEPEAVLKKLGGCYACWKEERDIMKQEASS